MFTIKAILRKSGEGLVKLRTNGQIPGVFYGAKKESTAIALSEAEFQKIWKEAGESSTITLETPSGKLDALIHEVQVDPVKGKPIHADFLIIDADKEIEVSVLLEFKGVAPAVKNSPGILVKTLHELEVKSLPKDLPHSIIVDISGLENLEDKILIKDLAIPKGVKVIAHQNDVVAMIAAIKEEKEEEVAPVDLSAIEVEKKGKKDLPAGEAGEEGEAGEAVEGAEISKA